MFSTSPTALLAYGIAGGGAVIFGLLIFWGSSILKSHARDLSYEAQLQDLLTGESDEDELLRLERGRNLKEKWRLYWQRIGVGSGMDRYAEKNNTAYKDVLVVWLGLFIVVSFLMKNPFVGFLAGSATLYAFTLIAKGRYNKQQSKIQDQIPGFLFALKANIQANETPVRAILKIVDNMPEPLRTDLMLVKQKILANASFAEALQVMVDRTTSNELRFLGTCLIQASGTGANIEPQLNTIQRVLEQRKKAADELQKAIKGTLPAIFISSAAIPGSFIGAYMIDPTSRVFWFKTFFSWIALAIILALYGLGIWLTRRMVDAIRNL